MRSKIFSTRVCYALASSLAVALTAGGALAADTEPLTASATYDRPAIEIGGAIADDGGSGEISLMAPLVFSEGKDLLFFGADAKFSGFNINDTDDTVYNVGGYLGYRRLLDDGAGVLGLWAGLDTFNTAQSNEFARVIAGIEYFGPHVIARANGFVPLDHTSDISATLEEYVPSGFDAELGLRMAVPMDSLAKAGEFRLFVGGYDFIGLADDGGDVLGGRARAELDLYPFDEHPDTRLSLEASYAYDKHSGDQYGAGVKLSIPLGVTNKITTHGAKDDVVAELDSFGQDLFQPIRRNRSNVSRIRTKDNATGGAGGVSLSNVCGGASGNLTLNAGLASTTIKQGALIGTIDPEGAATALNLSLGDMVDANGRTLTQLLASSPQTINTTLSFPASTVNFTAQTVEPAAAVAKTISAVTEQKISAVTVSINGNNCSTNVETAPYFGGFTLANVCGGVNGLIPTDPSGALSKDRVPRKFYLGYDPYIVDGATLTKDVFFEFEKLKNTDGQTLSEVLASKPKTLNASFFFDRGGPEYEYRFDSQALGTVFHSATVASTYIQFGLEFVYALELKINDTECLLNVRASAG
jgi:hypothetical protein